MENHSDISKNFIPYDLALELKELGFFEECLGFYIWQSWNNNSRLEIGNDGEYTCETIKAPLYQQAFRWLYQELGVEKGIMPLDIESQQLLLKELIDKLSSKRLLV